MGWMDVMVGYIGHFASTLPPLADHTNDMQFSNRLMYEAKCPIHSAHTYQFENNLTSHKTTGPRHSKSRRLEVGHQAVSLFQIHRVVVLPNTQPATTAPNSAPPTHRRPTRAQSPPSPPTPEPEPGTPTTAAATAEPSKPP